MTKMLHVPFVIAMLIYMIYWDNRRFIFIFLYCSLVTEKKCEIARKIA